MMKQLLAAADTDPIEIPSFHLLEFLGDTRVLSFFGWELELYNWIQYALIFVFLIYIYNKVFRTSRLTLLKNLIIYLIVAIGAFVLLIFQVDAGLPILLSLLIAVLLMMIVRVRQLFTKRQQAPKED